MLVCTAEEMRALDRATIDDYGIAGVVLMEVAGRGVVEVICAERDVRAARVVVICGRGNNGGDGFVIARHLASRGARVTVFLAAERSEVKGDALANLRALERMQVEIAPLVREGDLDAADETLQQAVVVVDALLGTGVRDQLGGQYLAIVERVNRCDGLRLAVDIPSGLHADTGAVLGAAVEAHHTVTFGLPKLGLVTHPGVAHVGTLHVVDIGIPTELVRARSLAARLLDDEALAEWLPGRPAHGHKGTFGHLLLIGGSPGKSGAALLAGEAAMRSGVGLCTIAAPPDVLPALECKTREVMLAPLLPAGQVDLDDSDATFAQLAALLQGKSALAVGPGMPRGQGSVRFMKRLLSEVEIPTVIDADGLNALVGQTDVLSQAKGAVVLTPHPGEMARLVERSVAEVQADRVTHALGLATRHGVTVLLKGARSIVAAPRGPVLINPTGNSGLASGGTGDVLTGVVGALLAQGLEPLAAAGAGAFVHGRAGDRARARRGARGLVASDVIAALGPVLASWDAGP